MPSANTFVWDFPWEGMIGVFNSLTGVVAAPVMIGVAVTLLFAAASFVVTMVKRGVGRR